MSNNLFRKGLALGVVAALGSTAFAGAPAFASDTVSLTPSAGTTYNTLLGQKFTLASSVGAVAQSVITDGQIMYKVTNAGAAALEFQFATGNNTPADFASSASTTTVYRTSATSATFKPFAAANNGTELARENAVNKLSIWTAAEATTTITVQAFLDVNNSGALDTGDTVSDVRTVKFIRGSEVTGTLALDPVNIGVKPSASLTLSGDINYNQIQSFPTAVFTVNGTAGGSRNGSLDDADAPSAIVFEAANNAAAGEVISAKAEWVRFLNDLGTKASATSSSLTVGSASTAASATQTLTTSKDVAAPADRAAAGTPSDTTALDVERFVRAGVKTLTAKVSYKNASDAALAAGAPVSVSVERVGTFATGDEVTVGSKTIKATSSSAATYFTTTDSTGSVELPISAKVAGNGTDIKITVTSGSVVKTFGIEWVTAAATSLIETKKPLGYDTRVIAKGGSVDVAYVLVDQFKQPFTKADTNYRVALDLTAGAISINAPFIALSNGAGSATIVENDPAAAGFTLRATAQSQTGAGPWTSLSIVASTPVTVTTIKAPAAITTNTIQIGTQNYSSTAPAGATANAAGLGNLADKDLAALDRRVDDSTAAAIGFGATVATKLSGTVTAADGSNVAGAAVKVAATGQAFSTDATGSTFVALNEITVYTDASGAYTVYAFSKTAGTVTYTTTAGAVTKTQDVKYAGVTTAGAGSVLTVAAPAVSQAGRAVDVTAKLVDKFGNPISGVEVKFTLTGAGYLTTASANTATDGSVATKIVVGVNDLGDAVVTATTTIDGKSSAVAKTVNFGLTDGYIDILNGKRASVTWSMAKGKRVAFLLNGVRKYNFVQTGDAELNLQFNLRKGTHNIKLVIGGVIVDDINVKITK